MSQDSELRNVPLKDIRISEGNVRKRDREKGIDELAQSIKDIGARARMAFF